MNTSYQSTPATNLVAMPIIGDINSSGTYLPNYKIVIGNQDTGATNTYYIEWALFNKGSKSYPEREVLLIGAIRNFIRKINFSELNESLDDGEINEDEFNYEIDNNNDKYAITLRNIQFPEQVILIADLINKIGFDLRDLTTSEVSEMFSVKESQLISTVNLFRDQIK